MLGHTLIKLCLLLACTALWAAPWIFNNPYPESDSKENIYYSSFGEQPKTLDPAQSYSSNEYAFISQIYEPLLEYHYFKRPYELAPLLATAMPAVKYLDSAKQPLPENSINPAYSVYTLTIKKGILYQPHPAFAQKADGSYYYHHLDPDYLESHDIQSLSDFKKTGTRELKADDYIYQIKRLANPATGSSIYGLMSHYILGFEGYVKHLPAVTSSKNQYVDLRNYPLEGVKKIDDYTFEITVIGNYQQFQYWLGMPFFAPIPWEADLFYSQKGMDDKNLSFDWYPVGTGPFMLVENNPNRSMVLLKNPNYHADYFPSDGTIEDQKAGYLKHAGMQLPLLDKAVYTLEKESIPRWNKFLQGYYDLSDVGQDSFDQAIRINASGELGLSPDMVDKQLHLEYSIDPSVYYMGFNMLDPVVGGYSLKARKLRQAISIAANYDEHISIFYNGRGIPAQGPLPPGIFGYREGEAGINPFVYSWNNQRAERLSIERAKQLLKEAGYPNGVDPKTKKPLILHYDNATTASPQDKAMMDWMRKQFSRIGIDLNIRSTLYNRFQDKMKKGNVQIFSWGWNADYPDPENFLFLLYGKNGKVRFGGENAANYNSARFDQLFDQMKNMKNSPERQAIIDEMMTLVRYDAPWVWGIHPIGLTLSQHWVSTVKPNAISLGSLKYRAVDVAERNKKRIAWNRPIIWPIALFFVFIALATLPVLVAYFRKERMKAKRVGWM